MEIDATVAGPSGAGGPRAAAGEAGDTRHGEDTRRREDPPPVAPTKGIRLSPAESALLGRRLGGCRIEELIGRGSYGSVFRARQIHLDRTVAVKTIRPELVLEDSVMQRFKREARALSRFTGPHVVHVHEAGEQDGVFYLVMQYVAGGNLKELANSLPRRRIPERDVVRYMRECVLGLQEAQRLGILHRDLKPDNILLDEQGRVKITDFGIAKVLDEGIELTRSMDQCGTPLYMSPEQCRGSELDFRSDMYSLGATFFYLLTNCPPARGSSILELIQTKTTIQYLSPAQALPEFADKGPLSHIIERMTALERVDRYENWEALLADIDALTTPTGTVPDPDRGRPAPAPGPAPRRRWPAILAAVLVIALGIGLWWAGRNGGEADPARTDIADNGPGEDPADDGPGTPPQNGSAPPDTDPPDTDPGTGDADPMPGGDENGGGGPSPGPVDPGPASGQDGTGGSTAPVSPHAGNLEEARNTLEEYRARFETERPRESLQTLIDGFLRTDVPVAAADRGDFERVRDAMYELSTEVEEARESLDRFEEQGSFNDPGPPFLDLERHVEHCRQWLPPLRGDSGELYPWARPIVDRHFPEEELKQQAVRALEAARERLSRSVPTPGHTMREGERTAAHEELGRLRESRARLQRLFPGALPSAETDPFAELEERLRAAEELGGLDEALAALTGTMDEVERLADWEDAGQGETGIPAGLEGWHSRAQTWKERFGAGEAPFIRRYRALQEDAHRWQAWNERVSEATAVLTGGGRAAGAAQHLDATDESSLQPAPEDVKELADALEGIASAYASLAGSADLDTAVETLEPHIEALTLLPEAARNRIRTAVDAVRSLARRCEGMAPVAAAEEVHLSYRIGHRRQSESVAVEAFLIDASETSWREWLQFLEAMNPQGGYEALAPHERELWPDERAWSASVEAGLPRVRRAAEEGPRLPAEGITGIGARAYARFRGAELPTHAQWWLAARGPDGAHRPADGDLHRNDRRPSPVDEGGRSARFEARDVHHLAGNVAEWLRFPQGERTAHVIGGSYRTFVTERSSSARERIFNGEQPESRLTDRRIDGVGVRLVVDPRRALAEEGHWLGPDSGR